MEFAELDPQLGLVRWFTLPPDEAGRIQVQGHVARVGGSVLCLYRISSGVLRFRLDDYDVLLDEATVIELERGETNTIVVKQKESALFSWTYAAPDLNPPLDEDPTPFIEEEDFDFGVFLHNVTHDDDRRRRIYPTH